MKKRGFTLIELLAVIVILAIIALIATPIIMNVIENTKKGSAERSAENYLRAVETVVASERVKGNVLEGQYTILENGNLCPAGETCTDDTDIDVDTSGNQPNSGTVYIDNGQVTTASTFTVGEYDISYDENGKLKAEKIVATEDEEEPESSICTYKGTDASKKYDLGAEYECDPGDGTRRTFYLLEDGDKTELEKTDGSVHYVGDKVGTAGEGEMSLIMSRNIGSSPYITLDEYKAAGGECFQKYEDDCMMWTANASVGPVTAMNYLKSETTDKGWTVEVYLPTYDQLYAVNGSTNLTNNTWLHDGYMLSTGNSDLSSGNYIVFWWGNFYPSDDVTIEDNIVVGVSVTDNQSVRPVITVAK